ncbi:MAG: protein kinase [Acidobacteria bacterium]|nr:protein kinase [Acidobacteriota bacterium]
MPLANGTVLGPYEVLSPLGTGGMGEVYRARDTRLEREVAVKVLPEALATDPELLARFESEVKAVAALSHPNIMAIHDYGNQDGVVYAVMELLSGQTVRDLLESGPIPLKQTVDYAIQVTKGLSSAHEKGIVHRDIKPENLFLTEDGHVKILDFGLAKRNEIVEAEAETIATPGWSRTTVGTLLGTVNYMSPEQARGEEVDARTDLFSLGVVLYEMATGQLPFKGKSAAELFAEILKTEPAPPSHWNSKIPESLDGIILEALEKDPSLRYQSAAQMRADLRRLERDSSGPSAHSYRTLGGRRRTSSPGSTIPSGTGRRLWIGAAALALAALGVAGYLATRGGQRATSMPTREAKTAPAPLAAPKNSIAVLPFVNMSSDKGQDYFADGIAEDLLNLLARVQPLQVAARTSSFAFRGKDVGIPQIARTLHVANILEGSVRKVGREVRITAQLVRASDGYEIWSQSYDRRLTDVFKIQDEIAADVVKQLKVKLLGTVPTVPETDPGAYSLYLQARELGRRYKADAFEQSDALYRRALAIDPGYAPAWNGLATNFANETNVGMLPNGEGLRQARKFAEKALAIDPDYAHALAELGFISLIQGDPAGAANSLQRALELDPTDLGVLGSSASLLISLGRMKQATAIEEYILVRDPVHVVTLYNLGLAYLWDGRYDDAISKLRTVLTLSPGYGIVHYELGVALMLEGRPREALAQVKQERVEDWRLMGLAMVYHDLGQKAESDTALRKLIDIDQKEGPYNIAYVYAYCGDTERAFEWLNKAAKYSDPGLTEVTVERLFDNIKSDPRWLPYLRKIGKAPEQLARIKFKVTVPREKRSS